MVVLPILMWSLYVACGIEVSQYTPTAMYNKKEKEQTQIFQSGYCWEMQIVLQLISPHL